MRILRLISLSFLCVFCVPLTLAAATDRVSTHFTPDDRVEAPDFEMSTETAYMLGWIGNPNGYEVGAQFVTARWRIPPSFREGWLRGYHQFYVLGMAEPIFRGPENYYYGISVGLRYVFVQPGSRFGIYISSGVGLGWIDSHADQFGAQGQDFTFNILCAVGVTYKLNERWQATGGALYQHLSNGGQTDPNHSLNLIGPQIGLTYSF